jgi:hypothetical protein
MNKSKLFGTMVLAVFIITVLAIVGTGLNSARKLTEAQRSRQWVVSLTQSGAGVGGSDTVYYCKAYEYTGGSLTLYDCVIPGPTGFSNPTVLEQVNITDPTNVTIVQNS